MSGDPLAGEQGAGYEQGGSAGSPPENPGTVPSEVVRMGGTGAGPRRQTAVTDMVEQASETAIGFALLMGDGLGALARNLMSPGVSAVRSDADPGVFTTSRRVALGVALDVQRKVLDATEATVQVVGPTARWLASSPAVQAAGSPVSKRLSKAYDHGLHGEIQAREAAVRASERTVHMVVPLVLDKVDLEAVVGGVFAKINLGPMVEQIMGQIDLTPMINGVMDQIELGPVITKVMGQIDMSALMDEVMAEMDMGPMVTQVMGQIDMGPLIDKVMGEMDLGPVITKVMGQIDMSELMDQVMGEMDLAPVIDKVLSEVDLSGVINKVVDEIQLSSVMMQATGGITEDVVHGVRNRTAGGDAVVERMAGWLRRRSPDRLPPVGLVGRAGERDPETDVAAPGGDADVAEES